MASSDNERLRRQLAELGYKAGPITETTRQIYAKKLKELLEQKKKNSRNSLQPKSLNSRSLLTFSSDESDLDSLDVKSTARKLRRRNRLSLPAPDRTTRAKPSVNVTPNALRNLTVNNITPNQNRSHFLDNSDDSDYPESVKHNYSTRNRKTNSSPVLKCDPIYKNREVLDPPTVKGLSLNNSHQEIFFSRSSHLISMILLSIVIVFFVAIGLMYVNVRTKDGIEAAQSSPDHDHDHDLRESDKLVLLNRLRNKLRQTAGAYDCTSNQEGVKRNMLLSEVEQYFKTDFPDSVNVDMKLVVSECLTIFSKHPHFGIKLYNASNEPLVGTKIWTVHSLESVSGDKSFACRLRQAFGLVFYKFLLVLCVLALVVASCFAVYWHWVKKKRFDADMHALIESIMSLLQSHELSSPDAKLRCLPLPHVRDMLIPLSERKQKRALWESAVRFIDDNDSRVRVELQNVDGEDYQVWRWVQPALVAVTPETAKKSWQGQAFEHSDGGTNSPPVSLTSCLKVRNMFDPDVEYGDDWHVHIQDAILDKCQRINGIVHIKVDTSSREGCVYVKCIDSASAGHVFRQLHGWWFDGNLITVRYLRLERYHERFPKAVHAKVPLKSLNNHSSFGKA